MLQSYMTKFIIPEEEKNIMKIIAEERFLKSIIELAKASPDTDTSKLIQLIKDSCDQTFHQPTRIIKPKLKDYNHIQFHDTGNTQQEKQIQEELDFDEPARLKKPKRLKKVSEKAGKRWSNAEENRLLELHSRGITRLDIAQMMQRSTSAINNKIVKFKEQGLIDEDRNSARRYTKEEKEYLKRVATVNNYDDLTREDFEEIGKKMNRTVNAVRTQLYLINEEQQKENEI